MGKAGYKRLIFVMVLLFMAVIAFFAYFFSTIQKNGTPEIRYDMEPITRRFPKIEGIERVIWTTDSFGETVFGRNTYWIKGYIVLSIENSALEHSSWQEDDTFSVEFIVDSLHLDGIKWYHSNAFDKAYEGELMYFAKFYFSPEKNILYVYAETD